MDDDPDEAARQATQLLDKNWKDPMALFLIASVFTRAEKYGFAANLFTRIVQIKPDRSEPWNNLGMCLSGMCLHLDARNAYTKAWERKKTALYAANIGITHMEMREHKKALEWCAKALDIDPQCHTALTTRGLSRLATGEWAGGWADGAHSIGNKFRKAIQYRDEPRWDGTPGKSVVVYGEQGLGDEIMYASCVPDACADNTVVVLECDTRLAGLFARSFPRATVYGTRRVNEIEWPNNHQIDASIPIGQLPQFYRKSPGDCPGTPYLIADPERRVQWRALFNTWGGKLKIGIAWSGGSKHNNPGARLAGLDAFRPLIQAIDADWVSLQYKDPTDEIRESALPVRNFRRACETPDYDDTAALVAELDFIIAVPTTVVHLAGALGVKAYCLVPPEADWNWQVGLPWYHCVELFKKNADEQWRECVERFATCLHRLRATPAAGVQRPAALDHPPRIAADQYLPASTLATAH